MKSFNCENYNVLQELFTNYLINQSFFGKMAGNKQPINQAKNLILYPMTFNSYCKDVYEFSKKDPKSKARFYNEDLSLRSLKILTDSCNYYNNEQEIFDQIKDVSFIYTNVMNCFIKNNQDNVETFNSNVYDKFVGDVNCFSQILIKDNGLEKNNEIYGGRFCEDVLNLTRQSMKDAERFVLIQQGNPGLQREVNQGDDIAQ